MARGGYRSPRDKTPKPSGVGRYSRRTDTQPINVPNVQDSTDLVQGDRQRLEAALRTQGIPRTPAPRVQAPAPAIPPPGPGRGTLPPELFSMPSSRPGEPVSAGLPFGAGPGPEVLQAQPPDPKTEILQKLYETFGDDFALEMLNEMRQATQVEPSISPMAEPEMQPEPTEDELEGTELPYPDEATPQEEPTEPMAEETEAPTEEALSSPL